MERTFEGAPRHAMGGRWRPWEIPRLHPHDEAVEVPSRVVQDDQGVSWAYVGVPPRHPFFGLQLDDCPVECVPEGEGCEHSPRRELRAPGGLQFCGLQDDRWWFGFACAHNEEQATREVRDLQAQLAARLPPLPELSERADGNGDGYEG